MIIELHLLQSFPTSNLNRDDVGQPKSVTFGGVTRGRISSQCLKRSARRLFPQWGLGEDENGVRTKRLLLATARILDGTGGEPADSTKDIVREALRRLGFTIAQKDLTQYLFFLGPRAGEYLADYCRQHWDSLEREVAKQHEAARKAEAKNKPAPALPKVKPDAKAVAEARRILDARQVADIALFGRMIANNRDFNVDAASQVAHAISTHAVATEFDYYTAVDDLKSEESDEDAGADMIGVVDFNAACYYRYANVDLDQLARNLHGGSADSGSTADGGSGSESGADSAETDLVSRAARAWMHAFVRATPSGKQNSMAAHTRPDTLVAVVREHGAWNLANAFLKPVDGTDIMADSTERMFGHLADLRGFYGDDGIRPVAAASVSGGVPASIAAAEQVRSLDDLVSRSLTAALG
ncbi:type I-E CRISPR-associated protein Cas7/Cse4/CasC [Streptomonospora sediminis]